MPIIKAREIAYRPSIMRFSFVNILNRRGRVDLLCVSSFEAQFYGYISNITRRGEYNQRGYSDKHAERWRKGSKG